VDIEVSNLPEDLLGGDPRAPSVVTETHCSLLPVNGAVPERPDVLALLSPYHDALVRAGFEQPFAFAPDTVSRTADSGGDSALGNFVTAALRQSAGADVAFVNTTGIRADVPKGTVTLDDLYRVLPFDDEVVTLEATGKDLARAVASVAKSTCSRNGDSQVQLDGGTLVFDCRGQGTATLAIFAEPIAVDRLYRVVTTSFLTDSGGWFDFDDSAVSHSGAELRDVVVQRVRASASCPEQPELPCIDARAGAAPDGRITVR
jgi:2',3'-cyclic-nucleotide 2'-phosphodiesterase (5'-nucleotidase family)